MEDEYNKSIESMLISDLEQENSEKQPISKQKPKVITQEVKQMVKFSENNHIADLQQRVIRLEYELLFIRDKLFEKSKNSEQPKLSPYGKLMKRRVNG